MKELTFRARLYILICLLAGFILLGHYIMQWDWHETWVETLVLSAVASLALLFKVEGSTSRTHYNISWVVFGCSLILFELPEVVIIMAAAHLIELIWHRYPWYIQGFNMTSYIIVAVFASMIYELINPMRTTDTFTSVIAALAALAAFVFFNHLMIGEIVWLARGENFVQSGIFQPFPIFMEWILLCMGAGAAFLWIANPASAVLGLLPLYLIYSTLRLPSLERKTQIDAKTGLYNYQYFMKSFEGELKRAERFDRPLTIIMADLDLLRNINNTYGHLAGDEVLLGVARILKAHEREYDIVARFGGEEFSVLMPETTPDQALPLAEAMRLAIEGAEFRVTTSVTPVKVTMSFGVAGRRPGLSARGIIHNADVTLYQAKLHGRNLAFNFSESTFGVSLSMHLDKSTPDRS